MGGGEKPSAMMKYLLGNIKSGNWICRIGWRREIPRKEMMILRDNMKK